MTIDEFEKLKHTLHPFHPETYDAVLRQWDMLAKPLDGLGDFERLIARIGGIQNRVNPAIKNRALLVFFSDNGIVEEGVSQSDASVTHKVAEAMQRDRSTVCVMAKKAGVRVVPVDVGMKGDPVPGIESCRIREGTRNFLKEAAMTSEETLQAIEIGYHMANQIQEQGTDLLLLGEMGIGNTSTATAIGCALLGQDPSAAAGRGAGLPEDRMAHKSAVLKKALLIHPYDQQNPMEILSLFGGYDIAAMVGAILYCAGHDFPVVIDGLITLSAVLAAEKLCPGSKKVCIASHNPREPMGRMILSALGLSAPIDAGLALGEGTGTVLLMPLLDVCMALYNNGIRFEGLGIDAYQRYEADS